MSKADTLEVRRALRRKKRDKKGGGFFWLWSKIRSALGLASEEGAGTGSALSGGGAASSAASRAATEALEAGQGLGRVSVLSPQIAVPTSQSSIWITRAAVATLGIGVVAAGAIGFSRAFSNPSVAAGPHFGPIASLIHIFHPGYGGNSSARANLSGNSGNSGSSVSAASPLSQASGNLAAQNSAKTAASRASRNSGKTAVFPSAFNGLPSAKLSTDLNDGGPAVAAQAPQESGQAAQEASLVKNGQFSANNNISVTPMVATPLSPYIAAGVSVGSKGRGFSRSYGGLRGMSEYVHPMDSSASGCASGDSSCDSAAGNAISQWQNAPIVDSGQGISMGGANGGTADNPPAANPTGSGGMGSGATGTSLAGDISNVCSADQIQKGYISNGGVCTPGFAPGQNNASPWQNDLQTANLLIELASGLLPIALGMMYAYWTSLSIPIIGQLVALAWKIAADIMAALVTVMGIYIIYLSTKIANEGGHSQALETGLMGGALTVMGGLMFADDIWDFLPTWDMYAYTAIGSLAMMLTKFLGG